MEPNTASAAATSPATVENQALSSVIHAQNLLPSPSPSSLISAPLATGEGDDAFPSVHGHATSPSFPALGAVDMTGADIFAQPEPPPATHFPTMLIAGGQSSSTTFLSEGVPDFADKLVLLEQLAEWQRDMPPLVSPPSGSGLPPPSSVDGGDGCGQPQSPDYELPPLPESLRIPELEEASTYNMSSTIGMVMPSNCGDSSGLFIGAEDSSRLMHLPPPWPDASSSSTVVNFNKYERDIISKDRSLQDLVNTDPKKVRRLIAYRAYSAKRKAAEDRDALELQRQVETLQTMRNTKSAELELVQARRAELQAEQMEISKMVHELDQQVMLKDAMSEALQAQINALNLIILNAVQMSSKKIDETNVWGAHGLHQQNSTEITSASGSRINVLHQQMSPDSVLLQQLQIQEQQSEHAQVQQPQ